jgi:hypothetical protein
MGTTTHPNARFACPVRKLAHSASKKVRVSG